MTSEDLLRMLILAYELGRQHGTETMAMEDRQSREWHKQKQRCIEDYDKLTKL